MLPSVVFDAEDDGSIRSGVGGPGRGAIEPQGVDADGEKMPTLAL